MKSARNTLPTEPANGVTCGIDWARDDHAVSIVDASGREIVRMTITTTPPDCASCSPRSNAPACERSRSNVPTARWSTPCSTPVITVVVISPNQVKNLRGRYGSAGNKDDRFDAFVLADTLRTDRARLHPLLPDTPATVALRQTCRARKDLVAHRVAVANQLRAHLKIVFPGAVGLFADLDCPISLAFLTRFDCQDRADWLSAKRLAAWLATVGYSGRTDPRRAAPPADQRSPRHQRGHRRRDHRSVRRDTDQHSTPRSRPSTTASPTNSPPTPTRTSSRPCPARAPSAPPDCSPRSATAAPATPPPKRWPAWLGSPPRPANRARSHTSDSVGPLTNNSATRSATSPATADTPTPGPPTSTTAPAPADTTTPTPYASWPAPGSTSSGTAGRHNTYNPANTPGPPTTAQPTPTRGGLTQGNSRDRLYEIDESAFSGHAPGLSCGSFGLSDFSGRLVRFFRSQNRPGLHRCDAWYKTLLPRKS